MPSHYRVPHLKRASRMDHAVLKKQLWRRERVGQVRSERPKNPRHFVYKK